MDVLEDRYPLTLELKMRLTAVGQTYFDQAFQPDDMLTFGRFGSAQVLGDFNGDGYDDLAVSQPSYKGTAGRVELYLYQPDNGYLSRTPDFIIEGEFSDYFGDRLGAGDLNSDGVADLIVGSPYAQDSRGKVWVFYGGDTLALGLPATLKQPAVSADLILEGAGKADEFGFAFLTSDLNADGLSDLIVSAPGDQEGKGTVYVFNNEMTAQRHDEMTVIKAGEADSVLEGEWLEDRFGETLAADDFDTDGSYDLAVGAPGYNNSQGRVYLFNEMTTRRDDEMTTRRNDEMTVLDAAEATNILQGQSTGDRFGSSLSSGDFDADGTKGLAVGAPHFSLNENSYEGRAYLFYQDETLWTNLPETCLTCLAENADVKVTGIPGAYVGSALLVADFDADDRSGLAVGSSDCGGGRGCVGFFYTHAVGDDDKPALSQEYVQELDHDLKWEGEYLSGFGKSLVMGDVNQDGFIDLAVGAPRLNDFKGRSYLFYGEPILVPTADKEEVAPIKKKTEEEEEEESPEESPEELPEEAVPLEEGDTEFGFSPEDVEKALKEAAQELVFDVTAPANPEIVCTGFEDGFYSDQQRSTCGWTDTAGPSEGTYYYCIDNDNTCEPALTAPERLAEIDAFTAHHTYLRVRTEDLGGTSEIVSFDLAHNNPPAFEGYASDGGSAEVNATPEGQDIRFSAMAADTDSDSYTAIFCRTNAIPIYSDGRPQCAGPAENMYCRSNIADSGQRANCSYSTREEPAYRSLWYAFACDQPEAGADGFCSAVDQGDGAEGSPFFIQHPAKFGTVTATDMEGGIIEPGDRLRFTLPKTELSDVPFNTTVTMHICDQDTSGFDYRKDECNDGEIICSSQPANPRVSDVVCDETVWSNQVPLPTPPAQKHFHVFVEHGEKGLVDGDHTDYYTIEDMPTELIAYTNEGDISILGGGYNEVHFSARLKDLNGWEDIQAVSGIFFDSDAVDNTCATDRNDCYKTPMCVITPLSDTELRANCTVEVYYNANASQNWETHVNVLNARDEWIATLANSDANREVPPLSAINQEDVSIPYDVTLPGEVSAPAPVLLTNLGNQPLDVLISGTDLVSENGIIVREFQKWNLSPDFDYNTQGYALVEEAQPDQGAPEGCADVTLPVHNGEEPDVTVYFKIFIPLNQKSDLYKGSVSFNPAPDSCLSQVRTPVESESGLDPPPAETPAETLMVLPVGE